MTLAMLLIGWMTVNYAILARLTYVSARQSGAPHEAALRGAIAAPAALFQAREA